MARKKLSSQNDILSKAKQLLKIYGQMASIMPFEVVRWKKLFWFLNLLETVDFSTYGLERTKLAHSIELDDAASQLDPQNPNPRSAHGGDEDERDLLDLIINSFNERWFRRWNASLTTGRVYEYSQVCAG